MNSSTGPISEQNNTPHVSQDVKKREDHSPSGSNPPPFPPGIQAPRPLSGVICAWAVELLGNCRLPAWTERRGSKAMDSSSWAQSVGEVFPFIQLSSFLSPGKLVVAIYLQFRIGICSVPHLLSLLELTTIRVQVFHPIAPTRIPIFPTLPYISAESGPLRGSSLS